MDPRLREDDSVEVPVPGSAQDPGLPAASGMTLKSYLTLALGCAALNASIKRAASTFV
ncbi:MAG: hypothetical protein K0R61_4282 [Microvirga sp.]|nr:hypothetical protein [Microvirga sp.]